MRWPRRDGLLAGKLSQTCQGDKRIARSDVEAFLEALAEQGLLDR